jgi:hypothetical protein
MSDIEGTVHALEARVRELEDTLAVFRLVASYGPAVDSGDDAAAAALWTDSGVYDLGTRVLRGADAVGEMVRGDGHHQLIDSGAAHMLGVPLVQIDGDRALATCYSNVFRFVDSAFEVYRTSVNRWELERTADGWRVAYRTTRLTDGGELARDLLRRGLHGDLTPVRASANPAPGT